MEQFHKKWHSIPAKSFFYLYRAFVIYIVLKRLCRKSSLNAFSKVAKQQWWKAHGGFPKLINTYTHTDTSHFTRLLRATKVQPQKWPQKQISSSVTKSLLKLYTQLHETDIYGRAAIHKSFVSMATYKDTKCAIRSSWHEMWWSHESFSPYLIHLDWFWFDNKQKEKSGKRKYVG